MLLDENVLKGDTGGIGNKQAEQMFGEGLERVASTQAIVFMAETIES